ncbi:MAG: hypothetical protein LUG98_13375 [Tannerellaceae bacterium]|nr:hypothetical protein [Tannerellaceae bacterium]
MEKKYNHSGVNSGNSHLEEPAISYGLPEEINNTCYNISGEHLLQEIEEGEKDIQEGRVYTMEQVRKIVLG